TDHVVILQRCAGFALNGIDGVVVAGVGAVFGDVYQRLVRCVASVPSHTSTVCSGVTIAVGAPVPTRFDDEVTVGSFTYHRALRKPRLIRNRGAAVLVAEHVQRAGYFFQCLGAGLGVDEGQALDPWRTVACRAAIVATDASVLCGG